MAVGNYASGVVRRILEVTLALAILVTVVALLGSTSARAADVVNPGSSFKATVTGGSLKVNTKLDLDVGAMNPAPAISNITIGADGSLSAPAAGFTFPQQVMQVDTPIGKKDIFIDIAAASPITGSIDPDAGDVQIATTLTIHLTSNDAIINLGSNCYVGSPSSPIPFTATAAADDTKGVHYDQYTGEATVVDDGLAIPAATGCPTILGNNVNTIVNDELGLPSASGQNTVTFALRFKPAPHGTDWEDPDGPDHVQPTIVDDTSVNVVPGLDQRSWLESWSISDNASGKGGNRVTVSLLVKHDPGRSVTGIKIDDDWDAAEDASGKTTKPVTAEQPVVQGGFNYSRVTYSYLAPTSGMGLTCPGIFGAVGTMSRTAQISVVAVLDDASESDASESKIRLVREDCNGHRDSPFMYGQVAPTPSDKVTPNDQVVFKFQADKTDTALTYPNAVGGYVWRWRNLDTGSTTSPNTVCIPGSQDNVIQTVTTEAPNRGRWVMEAELMSHPPTTNDCVFDPNPDDSGWNVRGHWFRIGAVDVNSPQSYSGDTSPEVTLNVPARPEVDGSLAISAKPARDPFDTTAGGKVQSLEWDLNDDGADGVDGFEIARLGDSRTGLAAGQESMLLDTSDKAPGIYHVRARVGDNGALGAADDIRRVTVPATKSYLVNTPPTANDLSVTTDFGKSVPTPLTAQDTNADGSHDPLTWTLITPPAHGFVSGDWPNRTYHPETGFSGNDSFTFKVDDGFGGSATGTVNVTVNPKPVDPVDPVDPEKPKLDHLEATFPEGRMNLNEAAGPSTSGVKVVDSTVPDPPVSFKTDYWNKTTGAIDAPGSDLTFPAKSVQMSVTDPIPLDLDVKIEFGVLGRITGNYNATSGAMSLNMNAHALITITAGGGNIQVMTCDVTPMALAFSSSGADLVDPGEGAPVNRPAKTWKAAAFKPVSREGAVTSLWASLPPSTALTEPLAPTASCHGTLDALIGGKGGFWLGGKVKVAGSGSVITDPPNGSTALFDGKTLHIRLKCGPQYKPACNSVAVPVTAKDKVKKVRKQGKVRRIIKKGKPMAKPIKRKIKAGKWIKVSFLIKPKYRAKVMAMSKKNTKTLFVQQKIKSKKIGKKKFKGKKPRIVYHRYKVRTTG